MNPRCIRPRPQRYRQQGTTLIEALVAVVVLSVGLLGMAGLQANALKLNQHSLQRSQASILAYDILDLLRSDPAAARGGGYDLDFGADPGSNTELGNWQERIKAMLGSTADGEVCRVSSPDASTCEGSGTSSFFRISVSWNEAEEAATGAAGEEQTFTLVGSL